MGYPTFADKYGTPPAPPENQDPMIAAGENAPAEAQPPAAVNPWGLMTQDQQPQAGPISPWSYTGK